MIWVLKRARRTFWAKEVSVPEVPGWKGSSSSGHEVVSVDGAMLAPWE